MASPSSRGGLGLSRPTRVRQVVWPAQQGQGAARASPARRRCGWSGNVLQQRRDGPHTNFRVTSPRPGKRAYKGGRASAHCSTEKRSAGAPTTLLAEAAATTRTAGAAVHCIAVPATRSSPRWRRAGGGRFRLPRKKSREPGRWPGHASSRCASLREEAASQPQGLRRPDGPRAGNLAESLRERVGKEQARGCRPVHALGP